MKKILSIICASLTMVSCVDTIILPEDRTVEEDFWKTKSDVESMVNGAYTSMATKDLQTRYIVWTSRSDELNVNTSLSNSNLNQFFSNTIQTDNGYCNWSDLYSVINNCNLVIDKSASVMDIDPNYLEGDHQTYVGEMKALRALCYFYLIRVFRDVPLVTNVYKESSQEMNIEQTAPGVILDQIIADLEESKDKVLSTASITDHTRSSRLTRCGVYAILADAYLWRASITGNASDYANVVACCDYIRDNRSSSNAANFDDDGYNLNSYKEYYNPFKAGLRNNDQEIIFQLLYDNNEALCNAYFKYKDDKSAQPTFYTNAVYSSLLVDDEHVFNESNSNLDVRGYESILGFGSDADENIGIRKYVSSLGRNGDVKTKQLTVEREYKGYYNSWIMYRATDIMLMKAEALTQMALIKARDAKQLVDNLRAADNQSDSLAIADQIKDVNKEISAMNVKAVRQVQIVNTRAHTDGVSLVDSTAYVWDATNSGDVAAYASAVSSYLASAEETQSKLESLIMNERARELCFEGKRWFDLLRYNYRKMTGVNYYTTLANTASYPAINKDFLNLIGRKYSGGAGITAKMVSEPFLYLPIQKREIEVNPNLKQNPVYKDNVTSEKNY